jgi:hypothetical protein
MLKAEYKMHCTQNKVVGKQQHLAVVVRCVALDALHSLAPAHKPHMGSKTFGCARL